MQYVEVVGIPGSGKTSLVNLLVDSSFNISSKYCSFRHVSLLALQEARSRLCANFVMHLPVRVQNKILYSFLLASGAGRAAFCRAIVNHAELVLDLFGAIAKEKNADHQELWARWLTHLLTCYQVADENLEHNQCLILEEGFVGRIATLFEHHEGNNFGDKLGKCLSATPTVDFLFVVNTPISECLERMSRRGFPKRMVNVDKEKCHLLLRHREVCIEKASNYLDATGTKVVKIPGTNDLSLLVQQVRREIESSFYNNNTISPKKPW